MVSVAQLPSVNAGDASDIHSHITLSRTGESSNGQAMGSTSVLSANEANPFAVTTVIEPVVAEALYQYAGDEDNHLSFAKGDIIEVWGREATGWWDGILIKSKSHARGARGWFPSSRCRSRAA